MGHSQQASHNSNDASCHGMSVMSEVPCLLFSSTKSSGDKRIDPSTWKGWRPVKQLWRQQGACLAVEEICLPKADFQQLQSANLLVTVVVPLS